jgi:hypothetical protein
MKKMTKITAGVALALAAGLSGAAQASSGYTFPSFTGAGAPGNGFASVDALASVTQIGPGSYQFSISSGTTNSGVLNFGSGANGGSVAVSNEHVTVTANLQRSGSVWSVTGGSYLITGSVAACSSGCPGGVSWAAGSGTLFSASLTPGALTASTGGDYLGMHTGSFGGWAVTQNLNMGATAESLYLYASSSSSLGTAPNLGVSTSNSAWNALIAALSSGGAISNGAYTNVGAYATVPLPLPGVLLLSGLAGLGRMVRRKSVAVA